MRYDLEHIFKYHVSNDIQFQQYAQIREAGKLFAMVILENTPAGIDQDEAMKLIRQTVMIANASVALGGRLYAPSVHPQR